MKLQPTLLALALVVLVGCDRPGPSTGDHATSAAKTAVTPVEFLMTSSVEDFSKHRPPYPARVRDVRLGYLVAPDSVRRYILYGEFLPESTGGSPEWTRFVTIQTSPYEQWLGGQAKAMAEQPAAVWLEGEYSAPLQERLDARR